MHDYTEDNVIMVDIDDVIPYTDSSRLRGRINEEALRELAESIKEHGMITPLVVSAKEGKYLIISGKRRYMAGLTRNGQLDEVLKSPEDFLRVVYGG